MLFSKQLIVVLLILLSILCPVKGVLYKLVKGWVLEKLHLDTLLKDEQELLQWLGRNNLVLKCELIIFTHATGFDLKNLPLVFYERYVDSIQLEQITLVLNEIEKDNEHDIGLNQIKQIVEKTKKEIQNAESEQAHQRFAPYQNSADRSQDSSDFSSHSSSSSQTAASDEENDVFRMDFNIARLY